MSFIKRNSSWLLPAALGAGALAILGVARAVRREFDLYDKVVLITGGSRGLGLALAREFASRGAKIAIASRDADELARAKADLEDRGAEVFDAIADVTSEKDVEHLVRDVVMLYGRVDVLVNNAGIIQVGPLDAQTLEDFDDAMNIHFRAPLLLTRAVLPLMRGHGSGRIVNIASIGGKVAVPHLAPYCASKFALVGLSHVLRAELAKDNIYVTTVCPGLMRTGSHVNAYFKGQNEKEYALFSALNAFPLASISAERAARRIVDACQTGTAEIVLSVPAQVAATASAIFPETAAAAIEFADSMLPSNGGIGTEKARGWESVSDAAPSIMTALADNEIQDKNEYFAN